MSLWCDTEVASDVPINLGAHRFLLGDAALLLVAYAIDGGPVAVWDLSKDTTPPTELRQALAAAETVTSHNAEFDLAVLRHFAARYRLPVPPLERWRCTQTRARAAGMLGGLEDVSIAFRLPGKAKDGAELIRLFCVKRAEPANAPEKWARFVAYARLTRVCRDCGTS
jgi:DNA polymerase